MSNSIRFNEEQRAYMEEICHEIDQRKGLISVGLNEAKLRAYIKGYRDAIDWMKQWAVVYARSRFNFTRVAEGMNAELDDVLKRLNLKENGSSE